MLRINDNFDALKSCMLGNVYDPEVFSVINNKNLRNALETLVIETREDLDAINNFLTNRGIQVLRLGKTELQVDGKFLPCMLTPRDHLAMIKETFYMPAPTLDNKWNVLRGSSWPENVPVDLNHLSYEIRQELDNFGVSRKADLYDYDFSCFAALETFVKEHGNQIEYDAKIDSAMYRIHGDKLFVGTNEGDVIGAVKQRAQQMFPDLEIIVIPSQGHLDGVMFIACEGLIFSSLEIGNDFYAEHFPGWRIVYNDYSYGQDKLGPYKQQNKGKWLLRNFDQDTNLHEFVETYLSTWVGDITESVFDVNMLLLDKNNVCCISENPGNFKILEHHGIQAHVLNFRHHAFWDAGIHCLTADIHRE